MTLTGGKIRIIAVECHFSQVIQVISARDQDLSPVGQTFSFRSPPEDIKNKNFTIQDFGSESTF